MAIRKDAGELLVFFYNQYVEGTEWIDSKMVIDTTKWDAGRINRAVRYLMDIHTLKITLSMGNVNGVLNFGVSGLNPEGIHVVEDKKEFKRHFGIEVGVPGVVKFSWGASQR